MEPPNANWITGSNFSPQCTAIVHVPREDMKMTAKAAEQCIGMLEALRENIPEDVKLVGLKTSNVGNARRRIEAILIELWMLRADTGHIP